MGCPSEIYTVNKNVAVAENGTVPFGTIVRRYGRNVQMDGTGIVLVGAGYYDIDVTMTYAPTAEGDVTLQLLQDGTPIPGASVTVAASAASNVALPVSTVVRNFGCCNTTVITAQVSAAGTAVNFPCRVRKS